MLKTTHALIALILVSGCASKEAETKGAKAGTKTSAVDPSAGSGSQLPPPTGGTEADEKISAANPSVNTSGAFLVALACEVVNASDTAATQTTFGCSLKDEHGVNASGSVEAVSATVAEKGSTAKADATISAQPAGAGYQFAFVAKVPPGAASALTFTAKYDGVVREFIFLVPAAYLTKTTADVDLYVDGAVGNDNGLCAEAAPCKTIARAVSLVADQIAHVVTIHVAATATYEELVIVANRGVTNGRLEIKGEKGDDDAYPKIARANGVFEFRNLRSPAGGIRLTGFDIEMASGAGGFEALSFSAAILVTDSIVDLADLSITGSEEIATVLRTTGVEQGTPAAQALYESVGYGLHVENEGRARLRGPVMLRHFANCLRATSAAVDLQADVTMEYCIQGLVGVGAKIGASRATDAEDPKGIAESFALSMTHVAFGVILTDKSIFSSHAPGIETVKLDVGAAKAVNSTGLHLAEGSSFHTAGGSATRKLVIRGFEYGMTLQSNDSFNFSEDGTQTLLELTGCSVSCMHAKASEIRATAATILIGATAPASNEAFQLSAGATIELSYGASMSLVVPPEVSGTAPYAIVATDRSLLSIAASQPGIPAFAPPSSRLYLTNGSLVRTTHAGDGIKGAAAGVGVTCALEDSWNYVGAPVVAGCIDSN